MSLSVSKNKSAKTTKLKTLTNRGPELLQKVSRMIGQVCEVKGAILRGISSNVSFFEINLKI